MKQFCTRYTAPQGWTEDLPRELDHAQTLVLAFGASDFADDPRPFQELRAAFPQAVIAGCSTAGEIVGHQVHDGCVAVAVVRFEHTLLRSAHAVVTAPEHSEAAGAQLASQLDAEGLRAVFVLSDGLRVNGSSLVSGLVSGLPPGVSVSGGLAGDGSRFHRTWVLADDRPQSHRVCAIGFYGERLRVGRGCNGGWLGFGPQRVITRSAGNVLYELDGKPALDLYKDYLGKLANELPGSALLFPLSIQRPGDRSESAVVRTILAIDDVARSMTFAGDVPLGFEARLMRTTGEQLIGSAAAAMASAAQGLPRDSAPLVVSVSCVGRRLVLGERTEEEVEAITEDAPPGTAHVGFYSYGEISPARAGAPCELHNQTMAVTVFSEA